MQHYSASLYFLLCLLCWGSCCSWRGEKHLAAVEKVGADFVPLVVECFGVWTPFALKMSKNIADRTIPRSGVTPKLAR